jgi:glycosyltransferase involved in cell wall biosynthesis
MKNKRVAILTGIYPPDSGGPATFAVTFSAFAFNSGYTVKVVSLTNGQGVSIGVPEHSTKLISRTHSLLFRTVLVILEILREFARKSDVIANGFFVETYIASLIFRKSYTAKIPGDIVWERAFNSGLTNLDIRSFQNQELNLRFKMFRLLFTKSLKRAKYVVIPSPLLFELCLRWGLPKEKLRLIHNSVDVDFFKPSVVDQIKYDCIVVNRLIEWKNVDQVMIACNNLNLSLLVVGDGPEMLKLITLANTLKTQVDFVGNTSRSELVGYLQSSRFYVLNSTADATAYSLLEARSCGLISIANINTGASEIISHEKDGCLTQTTSHKEIEKSLRWLLSREPSELREMSKASRFSTETHFNLNRNFQSILSLMVNE